MLNENGKGEFYPYLEENDDDVRSKLELLTEITLDLDPFTGLYLESAIIFSNIRELRVLTKYLIFNFFLILFNFFSLLLGGKLIFIVDFSLVYSL